MTDQEEALTDQEEALTDQEGDDQSPDPAILDESDSESSVCSHVDILAMEESVMNISADLREGFYVNCKAKSPMPSPSLSEREEGEVSSDEEVTEGVDNQAEIVPPMQSEVNLDQVPVPAPAGPSEIFPYLMESGFPPISWERSMAVFNFFNQFKDTAMPPVRQDVSLPPPVKPGHYGSAIFPNLTPKPNEGIINTLAIISNNLRVRERRGFHATRIKDGRFSHLYGSMRGRSPFCRVCSEWEIEPSEIYHRHYSSKQLRIDAKPDAFHQYNCRQCKVTPHYFISGSRIPLLLTSSTLHDHWGLMAGQEPVRDSMHLDVISIPGSKLCNLQRAFRSEYSTSPLPIDCTVVAGYNNVLSNAMFGGIADYEAEDLAEFLEAELECATTSLKSEARSLMSAILAAHPPHQVNSVAFVTLPIPPLLTVAKSTTSMAGRGFNLLQSFKIRLLNAYNEEMAVLNEEARNLSGIDCTRAPRFRSWGMKRSARPSGSGSEVTGHDPLAEAVGPFSHRLALYREKKPEFMLHFNQRVKAKMAKAVVKYISTIYDL